jgi:hypothetical protein
MDDIGMSPDPVLIVTATIDANIHRVWEIISDFGGLERWSGAVESCTADGAGVGSIRTVHIDGREICERLEGIDPGAFRLRYRPISGSLMPVDDLCATMALTSVSDDSTRLDWRIDGSPTIARDEVVALLEKRYRFRIGELNACLGAA